MTRMDKEMGEVTPLRATQAARRLGITTASLSSSSTSARSASS